jgi:cytochrome c nitrite reductase small subunit
MIRFFKWIIHSFSPPDDWKIPAIILSGILIGMVIHIAHVSKAASYLSSDPQTCINCHIMIPQYATWQRSSHAHSASCVDCHVPHDNIFNKYRFKASDGMRHATIFTLRAEPQVIRIREEGERVVQQNCLRCHSHLLQDTKYSQAADFHQQISDQKFCWDCHREVPHGRVRSLSATPYAQIPGRGRIVPVWLEDLLPVQEKAKRIYDGGK